MIELKGELEELENRDPRIKEKASEFHQNPSLLKTKIEAINSEGTLERDIGMLQEKKNREQREIDEMKRNLAAEQIFSDSFKDSYEELLTMCKSAAQRLKITDQDCNTGT